MVTYNGCYVLVTYDSCYSSEVIWWLFLLWRMMAHSCYTLVSYDTCVVVLLVTCDDCYTYIKVVMLCSDLCVFIELMRDLNSASWCNYYMNVITIWMWLLYECDCHMNVITIWIWLPYECDYYMNVITIWKWLLYEFDYYVNVITI